MNKNLTEVQRLLIAGPTPDHAGIVHVQATNVGIPKAVLQALRNQGRYCDCEVLNNVVVG